MTEFHHLRFGHALWTIHSLFFHQSKAVVAIFKFF